ncbi:MAG: carboxymuconolactone decarboxylase family protein [Acidobacteria bacterium]|nr:carboxymuconolactone decarboxylase family protein [Acidobacteriota bacterium]
MTTRDVREFIREREKLNEIVLKHAGKNIKRFFNIDTNVYQPGALPKKTKEMLGLVASLVLRCDDCIDYHLIQCHQEQLTDKELEEIMAVGLVVGGSITIPHLRRAFATWAQLKQPDPGTPPAD